MIDWDMYTLSYFGFTSIEITLMIFLIYLWIVGGILIKELMYPSPHSKLIARIGLVDLTLIIIWPISGLIVILRMLILDRS